MEWSQELEDVFHKTILEFLQQHKEENNIEEGALEALSYTLLERYSKEGDQGLSQVPQSKELAMELFSVARKERLQRSGILSHMNETKEEPAGLNGFIYSMEIKREASGHTKSTEDALPKLVEALEKNRVVILQGDTGCGKTTKVPRMLLNHFTKIACTQPRRIAAINVCRKVAADYGCKVGDTVGYAVRFDEKRGKNTRLHFLTDGILLKEIASKECLCKSLSNSIRCTKLKYDLVIIDEAHERNTNMDFLMGILKSHPSTKLLVMSATLDKETFINYFNAPLIEVRCRMHPIEHYYLRAPTSDYLKAAVETVMRIIEEYQTGDILIFLTGQEEIEQAFRHLKSLLKESVVICKLYSAMQPKEPDKAFKAGSKRKVILSTNIAETSVTIENIVFVIDSGYVKQKRRGSGIDFMEVIRVSKSQADQRAGRAGRTNPGKVFRLYTKREYDDFTERSVPEILRSNLTPIVLALKNMGINDVVNFPFIDSPSSESILDASRVLYYMGAISSDGSITRLGVELALSPLDPELGMVLHCAKLNNSLDAASTIAAFLSVGSPFFKPIDKEAEKCKALRKAQVDPRGDFYTFLTLYDAWHKAGLSTPYIRQNFLSERLMGSILQVKMQLLDKRSTKSFLDARKLALQIKPQIIDENLEVKIAESFCAGYFMNVARYTGNGYFTIFGDIPCSLHHTDPLFKKKPKYVLFYELVYTRREYMRGCLSISSKILQKATGASTL